MAVEQHGKERPAAPTGRTGRIVHAKSYPMVAITGSDSAEKTYTVLVTFVTRGTSVFATEDPMHDA